jgi:hypothetical protein
MLPRFLLIAVVVVASLSGAVAAQDAPNATAENTTAENTTATEPPETCSREITPTLRLCSAEYVNGQAVLVLDSSIRDRVTVTEAVSLTEPRELRRDSFVVDGKTEIRMPVTPSNGRVGVTIDDGTTLYGVPLEQESTLIGGPFTSSDAQAAAFGGGTGVALVTLFLVAKVVFGRNDEPERLA